MAGEKRGPPPPRRRVPAAPPQRAPAPDPAATTISPNPFFEEEDTDSGRPVVLNREGSAAVADEFEEEQTPIVSVPPMVAPPPIEPRKASLRMPLPDDLAPPPRAAPPPPAPPSRPRSAPSAPVPPTPPRAVAPNPAQALVEAFQKPAERARFKVHRAPPDTPEIVSPRAIREYLLGAILIGMLTVLMVLQEARRPARPAAVVVARTSARERPKSFQERVAEASRDLPEYLKRPAMEYTPFADVSATPTPEPEPVPAPRVETATRTAIAPSALRWVTVISRPSGANVQVGVERGKTPFRMLAPKGAERVEVSISAPGYKTWSVTLVPDHAGHFVASATLEKE